MNLTLTTDHPSADPSADEVLTSQTAPTSFGVFKPVGQVMVGLPTQPQADSLRSELLAAAWPADAVQAFVPHDSVTELETLVDNAGPLAGFGYEITLLRRYLKLAREGSCWLLVRVDSDEQAAAAAEAAKRCGATLAVHYKTLTVEELM